MPDNELTREELVAELQELRQRMAQLMKVSEELDASAYTVAHDLKRSLTLILGFTELLLREHMTISREDLFDCLHIVLQSGRKMDGIVDELVLLVHVRDDKGLSIGPLEMASIVTEALDRLEYIVKRKQAQVTMPDRWPVALGYAPWVGEVWFACISEALQFDIDPLHIVLDAKEGLDEAYFRVRVVSQDLDSKQRARLSQTCGRFKSGLVQRIMDKLNGQFSVTGDKEKGCEFTFTLPIQSE